MSKNNKNWVGENIMKEEWHSEIIVAAGRWVYGDLNYTIMFTLCQIKGKRSIMMPPGAVVHSYETSLGKGFWRLGSMFWHALSPLDVPPFPSHSLTLVLAVWALWLLVLPAALLSLLFPACLLPSLSREPIAFCPLVVPDLPHGALVALVWVRVASFFFF